MVEIIGIGTKTSAVKTNKNDHSKKKDQSAANADLHTILEEVVEQFGWFQAQNIFLALIAIVFVACNNNTFLFTAARIKTRCHIPECDGEEPKFTASWLLNAIPGTSLNSFDNCQRFNMTEATHEQGTCPASWFNHNQTQGCERYLYEDTDSIVYDFDLACDEWRRSLVGTIRLSGTMFAQTITGYVSDRWGRRTALIFNSINSAWIGILKSFSTSYIMFITAELLSSVLGTATFQCAYILVIELVSSDKRVLVATWLNTFLALGQIILGLIAFAIPYWKDLILVVSIPPLLTITFLWFMTESVRWYIIKGRFKDAENVLKNIAKTNKMHISDTSFEVLKNKTDEIKRNQDVFLQKDQSQSEPSVMKLLFRHKAVLYRCIITPYLWITFTLIFFGLAINAVDISGNKYLNYIVVSGAHIPGYWISWLTLNKVGRKPVLVTSYWVCAACQTSFIFMPRDQYVLALSMYMIASICIGTIFSALYIYTAELYPTSYRHIFFGFSSTMGRLGAILATFTPVIGVLIWDKLPSALFAGCACVAGALVLLLPETRGARLPDSMQEAADLGRKKQSTTAK